MLHEIALLRLRALLARAHGDEASSRDHRDRYRAMAISLGFEGQIERAEAMTRPRPSGVRGVRPLKVMVANQGLAPMGWLKPSRDKNGLDESRVLQPRPAVVWERSSGFEPPNRV
ncbi:MAG TPA: hypothetical protein VF874_02845, partial [Mycobacterium sp.]